MGAEGARVLAGLISGDGPLSVHVRPSSLKRDCDRRTTTTGEKCRVYVHGKSRLTLGCLCGHSGQETRARREPARTGCGPSPARSGPSRGSFQGKEIAVAQDLRTLVATREMPRLKAEGRRAISVQLARVMSGQPRLLPVSELGCLTASSATICPIPKLTAWPSL